MNNNQLIAEFMGVNVGDYTSYPEESPTQYVASDLLYHSSWDWLMPVVDKIDKISNDTTLFKIENNRAFLEDIENYNILIDVIADSRLEATYKAVVEFIKEMNDADYRV